MADSTNLPAPTAKPFAAFGFRGTEEQLLGLLGDAVDLGTKMIGSRTYASLHGLAVNLGLIQAAA